MTSSEMRHTALPLVAHHFRTLADAIEAAEFGMDSAVLHLPIPDYVPFSDAVLVRFRVGGGPARQAAGRFHVAGGTFVVRFEGEEAAAVKSAIERLAHRPRRFERYPCAIPATIELRGGETASAIVTHLAVGGAGVGGLEHSLPAGALLHLRLEGTERAIPARVMWSIQGPRGASAGLLFAEERESTQLVRRLVTDVAAGR